MVFALSSPQNIKMANHPSVHNFYMKPPYEVSSKIGFFTKMHNLIGDVDQLPPSLNKELSKISIINNKDHNDIHKLCKDKVLQAIKSKKIFTIYGNGPIIRSILLKNGWLEKLSEKHLPELQQLSENDLIKNLNNDNVNLNNYKTVLISKYLQNYPTTLLWQNTKLEPNKLLELNPYYRNRIQRSKLLNFTTKEGLIGCIENSYWTTICCKSEIRAPRFHRLSAPEEKSEFIDDYQMTYCLSLLKFINEQNNNNDDDIIKLLFDENGKVSIDILKTAIKRIHLFIYPSQQINKYINFDNRNQNKDWKNIYLSINLIINREEKFTLNKNYEIRKYLNKCKKLVNDVNKLWPNMSTDGYNNLWILKPASRSQGFGIVIKNNIDDIFTYAYRHIDKRYIVQKYIERPLLIYNTKFDIRQYALVTITDSHIYLWMYKDCCYLRFSSQVYQLSTLTESVHLTNNSVQKKYKNDLCRSSKLPENNMWSLDEFKKYLIDIGKNDNDIWQNHIYINMKKNFIAVVLSSLIDFTLIPNSFEFFGCDFMLDENYEPILIEINAVPDMSPSTNVTKDICPNVFEDIINVVTNFPIRTPKSGQFELIYSISYDQINNKSNNKFTQLKIDCKSISTISTNNNKINKNPIIIKKKLKTNSLNKTPSKSGELNLNKIKNIDKPKKSKRIKKKK